MVKPIIAIDAGHGGKDSGTSCKLFKEKDIVLKMSHYQLSRCQQLGIPAILIRTNDSYISLKERSTMIKESGAKYCLCNHINAFKKTDVRGATVIHSIYADGKLAHSIKGQIVNAGAIKGSVWCKSSLINKKKDYYHMHRETGSTRTVIVEYGFASNPSDALLIYNKWSEFAEASLRGLCFHAGLHYEMPHDKPQPNHVKEGIEYLYTKGLLTSTILEIENNEPLPAWAVGLVLKRYEEGEKRGN